MQIGSLDRRIVIEEPSTSPDDFGELIITWSTYRTVWADVNWKGGNEREELQRITATSKVVFTIRNLSIAVTEMMRINYDSKYYYIKVINEIDGRDAFLELETEQKD
tara:strand:+ start:6516 stop:6836 length:321 start_codon:yes stop_codon:yes gene_type:complete